MKRIAVTLVVSAFSFLGCSSEDPTEMPPPSDLCGPLKPTGRCAAGYRCHGGNCFEESEFCSSENPTGLCGPNQTCSGGQCVAQSTPCSVSNPNGTCEAGKTCRSGQCIDDALLCSVQNPTGLCPDMQSCLEGACVNNAQLCSPTNLMGLCPSNLTCTNGACATANPCAPQEPQGFCDAGNTCIDGTCTDNTLLCSMTNQTGVCPSGETCLDGSCVDDGLLCSMQNPSGVCPTGETCFDGGCINAAMVCSVSNPTGLCATDETCVDGTCTDDATLCSAQNPTGVCTSSDTCFEGNCVATSSLCSMQNPMGLCSAGQTCDMGMCIAAGCGTCGTSQTCLDGICRDNTLLCDQQNPTGLCESGFDCIAGSCVDSGAGCSSTNPTGICPSGEICNNGMCEEIDQPVLCDDDNPCTRDWFDFPRNRCGHEPQTVVCTDGNACTMDACVMGACVGTPIGGCIEPPTIDPFVTPTNDPVLNLSGTKPGGSSIEINSLEAVPQNPDMTWQATLNLAQGDNAYVIRSIDQGVQSETIEIHVVYDDQPPTTSLTPAGGVFLNGITVRVVSDETAIVYYTTDGADPDEWSSSFQSVKEFRVFDDTTLSFKAKDLAGNWETAAVTAQYEITSHGNGWKVGPTLFEERIHAGAAVLDDVVYVVGGSDGLAPQAGAFGLDLTQTSTTWTIMASLPDGRAQVSLAALDGALYLVGGENNGTPVGTLTRLIPGGASWSTLSPMPSTRFGLVAVPYLGKLYVLGGKTNGGAVLPNFEVYDRAGDSWSNTVTQMPRARYAFGAVEHGGKIYVVGGEDGSGTPIAEVDIYDISGDSWSTGAPMPTPRSFASVTLMKNSGSLDTGYAGVVAAGGRTAGGTASARVEEYIIDDDQWRERSPLPAPRHSSASVQVIATGAVDSFETQHWSVGGQTASTLNSEAMIYTAPQDYVRLLNQMPEARFMHAAAALDEKIYLFGGRNFQEAVEAWEFDPETETYTQLDDLASFQNGLSAAAVGDYVYAIGGANNFGNAVATVRAYDPVQGVWVDKQPMPTARRDAAITTAGNQIFVIGGFSTSALQTFEIYDADTDTWQTGPVLPVGRSGATAVAHHGDLYLVGGRDSSDVPVPSMLRLPAGGTWQTYASGTSIPAAYGAAFLIHDDQLNVFAGRNDLQLSDQMWSYEIGGRGMFTTKTPNLVDKLDFVASAYLNGSIYLFGGNGSIPPGPEGVATVQKIEGRCFNGVLDGRETAGIENADSGGGCPLSGFAHHTGLGTTFYNNRPVDITSQQSAIDACNAHYNITSCSRSCSGSCDSVTRTGDCSCSATSYRWNYGDSCYSSLNAGSVETGGTCNGIRAGTWD